MKKRNITIASIIALSSLISCEDDLFIKGEGQVVEVEHAISTIDEIEVEDDIKVFVTQSETGTSTTIRLVGQQNIIDNLEIKLEEGDLELEYDKNVKESAGVEVYISMPILALDELSASGASRIEVIGAVNTPELEVSASGIAQISLDALTVSTGVEVSLSGSSHFNVEEGTARSLVCSMSGDSKLTASDFIVKDVVAQQSGGSESAVHATGSIVAKLSGGSKLYYNGSPSITESLSGGSEVLPLGK